MYYFEKCIDDFFYEIIKYYQVCMKYFLIYLLCTYISILYQALYYSRYALQRRIGGRRAELPDELLWPCVDYREM